MLYLRWGLALGVGGFLIFFGFLKFAGGAHIFPYIEYKATAAGAPLATLAYPFGKWATGLLEIASGALLIAPATRQIGATMAPAPFLGALVFHLSPLLGVVTPIGYADPKPIEALAAGGPFARTDFSVAESNALFMVAAGGFIASIINLVIQRAAR